MTPETAAGAIGQLLCVRCEHDHIEQILELVRQIRAAGYEAGQVQMRERCVAEVRSRSDRAPEGIESPGQWQQSQIRAAIRNLTPEPSEDIMTIEDCDREAAKAAYREWLKGPMDGTDYCEIADIAARISRKATIAGVVAYLRTIPLDQMDGAMIDAIECGEAFGELKP